MWAQMLALLRGAGHRLEVMFLDASDEVLLRRFSETRRRHPLSGDDLIEGVRRDREVMGEMRHGAAVVDTSSLNMHQLKKAIQERYGGTGRLAVTIVSFGFKHGLPLEFNLVYDVRFLPNPHFDPALTHMTGRDPEVVKFVMGPEGTQYLEHIETMLRFALPQFQKEGKLYVTVCIGCTGGRHRSVAMVEELRRRLGQDWDILVRHRDVERGE
jgi:RNase adapter protein RapZ